MKKILITGAAGFIGFHLARHFLEAGECVVGIDNMNDYYDVALKNSRLDMLMAYASFTFYRMDIREKEKLDDLFESEAFDYVVHLAAQAGVRHSLEDPYAYIESNVTGFLNILEGCRHYPVKHLIFASSSSVYGDNDTVPFKVGQRADHPVSLYAATKKSNELMAFSYSHLYKQPTTGLRFFTVYGPYGRPDMAYYKFTHAIINGEPIEIYNHGDMERDFTYVDDIISAISRVLDSPPDTDMEAGGDPYAIHNIGNSSPVRLERFVSIIESCVGKKAERIYKPMQKGDVKRTYADVSSLEEAIDFKPNTSLEEGISEFVRWYKDYYTNS